MNPRPVSIATQPAPQAATASAATQCSGSQPALTLAPRAPITALRWSGRDDPAVPLPTSQEQFNIGAGACDAIVPPTLAARVAALHATLTRVHTGLRVEDHDTATGTFRGLGSPRLASFQIEAGESFWIGDVPILALDTHLEVLRPRLAWCLGLDRHAAIDLALELVAAGRPIALLGSTGTDAARLAAAIHAASPQRANAFVSVTTAALPPLEPAVGGTVFVDLDRVRKLPAPYVRTLFDAGRSVRIIFAAADDRRVRACLDTYRDQVRTIELPPLAQRPGDLRRLLAIHWIEELHTQWRVDELGPGLDHLARYRWPRNLDELREHSPRLLAYLEHGGLRPAAHALGIKHQTLCAHFQRIGFVPSPRWPSGRGATIPRAVAQPGPAELAGKPHRAGEGPLVWRSGDWADYDWKRWSSSTSMANPTFGGWSAP